MSSFLEAVRERVVVYDGATGTNLQLRELSADDFGGPGLEGCNEVLCDTRPDVVADLHRSFFDVGVDVGDSPRSRVRRNRISLRRPPKG